MCEVTCEEIRFGTSNSSMLLMDEESQWVACGRKLSETNLAIHARDGDEDVGNNDCESFSNLPLELCDPMRRKITSLKPSLTPGAGTRIMRRRKPVRQDSEEDSVSEAKEAFRQWREAMRALARLPEGIPQQFRRRIWLLLATHQLNSQHINWPRLAQTLFAPRNVQTSETEERLGRQIEKDLHRTGSGAIVTTEVNRTALKRVLTAYARWNRRVGYCQGFNILASVILNVMELDEEAALKVMIFLIDYVLPESYFARNLRALSVDVAVFRDLLALRQPTLASHLQKLQQDAAIEALNFTSSTATRTPYEPPLTDLFAIQWFVTLFATCLPMNIVLRIWDAILLEGSEVVLRAGLVVMQILSLDLMRLPSADRFYSSVSQWMEEIASGADRPGLKTKEFISCMYDLAPLPWPRLGDLRKRYAAAADVRREEVPTVLYGDGYDEEAKKTKFKWWHIKSKQAIEESLKSSPKEHIRLEMTHQGNAEVDRKQGADSTVLRHPQASPSLAKQKSDSFKSADDSFVLEINGENCADKLQVSHLQHQQQQQQHLSPSLAIENRQCTSHDSIGRKEVLRCTPFQFDDSFLQTINEWQRRNAAAFDSNGSEDTDSNTSEVSDLPSLSVLPSDVSPVPGLRRTLLSIAAQKTTSSPASLKIVSELLCIDATTYFAEMSLEVLGSINETKSSTHSSLPLPSRSSVLAKAIVRDRTRPNESFSVSREAVKVVRQSYAPPALRSPSSASISSCEARTTALTEMEGSPAPPWAAAMAAIGVSQRPFDRRSAL
ncbi:unnamed protein product [Hydatigera taeniaeformis]|uniref:Rab-GAP TBC domain-containing protein n=1 Tax=Hydatigena taeniaeformis TaxID=6205 RepID=A0A158RDB7_HYDTA|nr:unnamed protein product [Hydatigera taeniaeformis]